MESTKEKILTAALKLFNQNGMVNVRLQHIADEAFVSIGNMAYHYKNKEAIFTALYEELTKKQKELLAVYKVIPLFENMDLLIQHTFRLQQEYVFFYLDTLEIVRAYPDIGAVHQQHIASKVRQLISIIDFNVSRGALKSEPESGAIENLALQVWMTMDFWLTQQAVRTSTSPKEEDFRQAVWNLFYPNFTEMGKMEFNQMLEKPYDFYF